MVEGVRVRRTETSNESTAAEAKSKIGRRSPTLTVGAVDDPLETEADMIAKAAVSVLAAAPAGTPDAKVQRRTAPTAASTPPPARVARSAVGGQIGAAGGEVDVDTDARIRRARGGGHTLEPDLAQRMSSALGSDVSHVRIHTGAESRELNDRIQAEAFTVGNDVHFRDGMPDTSTATGQHLLAHELAHTLQQPAGRAQRSPVIHRKPARVLVETDLYKADANDVSKIDDSSSGMSRAKAVPGEALAVDPNVTRVDSATPAETYVQTTQVGSKKLKRFVRVSAVELVGGQATPGGESLGDKVDKSSGKFGDTVSILPDINDAQDSFKANGGNVSDQMESDIGVAAGVGDTMSMVAGLASAIVTFQSRESNGGDKAGAVLSGISSVGSGAKGFSGMVDKGGGGEGATAVAQGIAGFADAFAGIKDTFFAIKHIVELVKEADQLSDKEKFKRSMEVITDAMNAAKSGVSAAKSFMDLWGGGAGAPLVAAVPGFGIALSCVDIVIRAVDLVDAQIQRSRMESNKRSVKESLGGSKGKTLKGSAEAFIKQIDDKRAAGEDVSDSDAAKYEQYREYLLAKGLQYIARKRSDRAILKISVAMAKIAGDAAVLGGASAPVGIGIKGGAMALDVGASAFRRFKQWGRDKAAKSGTTTGFFSVFDKSKSTTAKLEGYNKMVDKIFDMIVKAASLTGFAALGAEAKVADFVGAIGLSLRKMYALKDNPFELRMEMIKAMKKRE